MRERNQKLKIIIFIIIFIILVFKLNKIILPLEVNRTTVKYGLSYNANIYFVGNSHSYWAYNPLIIENITENYTYNISTSSQSLESSYFIIDNLLDKKETKIIFFELFNVYEEQDKKITTPEKWVYDNFKLIDKIRVMKYYYSNKILILRNLFNFHEYHSNFWKNKDTFRIKKKFSTIDLEYTRNFTPLNGYIPHFHRDPSYAKEKYYKNIPKDYFLKNLEVTSKKNIPLKNREILIKLLEKAKEKNKEIIFLISPFYFQNISNYEFLEYINSIQDIIKNYQIEVIDFNSKYTELNIEREDFKDSGHLNYWGANKLSFYLAGYLIEKGIIKNEKNSKVRDKIIKNEKILKILSNKAEKIENSSKNI